MTRIVARSGAVYAEEAPEPELLPGHVLVRTEYSAISPGTELDMIRRSGERPVVLGYNAVGIVERAGDGVTELKPGQRVACYGAPYVHHASRIAVPVNLTAPVPDGVAPEEAAFAGLGAIAIHALRVADLRFGESAVVVGLGLLGHLTCQIAAAAACPVVGYDLNAERAAKLSACGVPLAVSTRADLEAALADITGGDGADAVLLCAGGDGQELIDASFGWVRDRGKIVLVGNVTANFSRGLMFQKEAQVLVSRAGGPGRYDARYERDNLDYPVGYVRWTEGRNMREYIRLLAEGRISVKPLIGAVYPAARAQEAYGACAGSATAGTLFRYD
ncbi:zinc-binding alcohol dehydrogenase [Paenibacillus thermoaerophilus]|uniref:Zinc-binding alcohol dehydrogenase n=1 Tax=Paenibacillus thermoaerophilus TaxID=1215385 RepID=A0ABW2V536_9BACL